jgi:hypothetical protein
MALGGQTRRGLTAVASGVVVLTWVAAVAQAAPRMGRLNMLVDVHGYATPEGVMVPLRGVAEWLGATVDYAPPTIVVKLGKRWVTLKLGANSATVNGRKVALSAPARVYGSVTCVPVRLVAEGLGAEVEYRAGLQDPEVDRMGGCAFVQIRSAGREARVIVHGVPPDVVAGVVAAWDREGSRYGHDWIIACLRTSGPNKVESTCLNDWFVDDGDRGAFTPNGVGPIVEWVLDHGVWRESTADWD